MDEALFEHCVAFLGGKFSNREQPIFFEGEGVGLPVSNPSYSSIT